MKEIEDKVTKYFDKNSKVGDTVCIESPRRYYEDIPMTMDGEWDDIAEVIEEINVMMNHE